MTKLPTITMWRNKDIRDMNREELIEALEYCVDQLDRYRTPKAIKAMSVGQAELLRRGYN